MSPGGKKPFIEKSLGKNKFLRTFKTTNDDNEFIWHRDAEDRIIEVISGTGWSFQKDNCLPVKIIKGDKIIIEKLSWHRIIKGDTDLTVIIEKCL